MCKLATGRPGTEVDPAVRVYIVLISGTLLGFSGAWGGRPGGGASKTKAGHANCSVGREFLLGGADDRTLRTALLMVSPVGRDRKLFLPRGR